MSFKPPLSRWTMHSLGQRTDAWDELQAEMGFRGRTPVSSVGKMVSPLWRTGEVKRSSARSPAGEELQLRKPFTGLGVSPTVPYLSQSIGSILTLSIC